MPENTKIIAGLIAGSVKDSLSDAGKVQLARWASSKEENQALLNAFIADEERNQRLIVFQSADGEAIWANLRRRARNESGYELGILPAPVKPLAPIVKFALISIAVLAIVTVVAIFYMTISNIKNNRVPVKSMQQRSFRF